MDLDWLWDITYGISVLTCRRFTQERNPSRCADRVQNWRGDLQGTRHQDLEHVLKASSAFRFFTGITRGVDGRPMKPDGG